MGRDLADNTNARPDRLILAAGSMLDQPPEMLATAAAGAGFDGIGLRLSGEHAIDDVAAFRRRVADLGLTIHDTEVHRISHDAVNPTELFERSAALGASAVLVVSDLADRNATIDEVARLTEACGAYGLRLGLEYMAWTNPATPTDAIAIAIATGCELVVDPLHHHRVGAGTVELDRIIDAGVLGWVQLCDAPLISPGDLIVEARHGRLPPGDGELPLTDFLAHLPSGIVYSVEVQSDILNRTPPDERAQLLAHTARRTLAT